MGIILETETFNKFGYYSNSLKPSSCKLVVWECNSCKVQQNKKYRDAVRINNCLKCSNKINANTNLELRVEKSKEWHKNNKHPLKGTKRPQHVIDAIRKAATGRIRSQEELEGLSKRTKGENNPFYGKKHSEESLEKMSTKIIKRGKDHPLYGIKRSKEVVERMRATQIKIAKRGKDSNLYGNSYHGKGVWYLDKNNNKIWLRSSYEEKFAIYLDTNNINWVYEPQAFPIVYGKSNKEGTYRPDFYLVDLDKYIEVKGWWRDDALEKYEAFVNQYPHLIIEVYDKKKLRELGISIK